MLYKTPSGKRTLYRSRPLMLSAREAYQRPGPGKSWFQTTTTVWRVDELIRRRVRDWRRLTGEDGHTGGRAETMRQDHDSVYTGTHSVYPAPLIEWTLLRYGGEPGGHILDAFAGGPPRGLVSSLMGYKYTGFEIRQEQITENKRLLKELELAGATYINSDGRFLEGVTGPFDFAMTCPPYHDLEKYSDEADDMSNMRSYAEFNAGMAFCAQAHTPLMRDGAFICITVGNFRDKQGEIVDFRADTVDNFKQAGFKFWQDIVLCKNFASAAQRAGNSWKGQKLVPCHEHLLVFRAT